MSGWTKLFSSMLESSVCELPIHARWVWVCMLAICDVRGFVSGTTSGLARRCNVTREQFEEAIALLTAPDHTSRSTEMEGRRLIQEPGGWLIINRVKFRDCHQDVEGSRAPYMRAFRANKKKAPTLVTRNTTLHGVALHNPEVEKEKEKEKELKKKSKSHTPFVPPTTDDITKFCNTNNIHIDVEYFFNYYTSKGWTVGKSPMKDWKAAIRNWHRNDRQSNTGGNNAHPTRRIIEPHETPTAFAKIDATATLLNLQNTNGV